MIKQDYWEIVEGLLCQAGFSSNLKSEVSRVDGDGSDRRFYRITSENTSLIAVFPCSNSPDDLSEARSSYLIGTHLLDRGIPVPEIFAYDRENGALLFEDCGDLHLQDALHLEEYQDKVDFLYQKAIDSLILLQIEGYKGYEPDFCWDTPRYDMDLMLVKESGYFFSSFCRDYLGINDLDPDLSFEAMRLARRAARLSCDYLMHRDFQSRNILVAQGEIKIIDFQGARFGPLGYDIASLLIDPYAGLGSEKENRFFDYYLSGISAELAINPDEFREGYYLLALQRNLQILGAFAFLSQVKGKIFFGDFLKPALYRLRLLLQDPQGEDFPRFREFISKICGKYSLTSS